MIQLSPKFGIGDIVYYALPEGNTGIITDITWRLSSNIIWYNVTFDPVTGEVPCREFELTEQKRYI